MALKHQEQFYYSYLNSAAFDIQHKSEKSDYKLRYQANFLSAFLSQVISQGCQ
jgi:hypothetical protein